MSQKADFHDSLRVLAWPGVRFSAWNPYTALLYSAVTRFAPMISVTDFSPRAFLTSTYTHLHLHWPEFAFSGSPLKALLRGIAFINIIKMAKRRNFKVVWTAHNLNLHEKSSVSSFTDRTMARFVQEVDGFIALTRTGRNSVIHKYPVLVNRPSEVIPHGHYINVYPSPPSKLAARANIGVPPDSVVFSFCGLVRPYKNLPKLLEAFGELPGDRYRLIIGGMANSGALEGTIRGLAAKDPRVLLDLRFLDAKRLTDLVGAADLVVLPFSEVFNSGSAILALSLMRPVLVPAQGALVELSLMFGAPYVQTYQGALTCDVLEFAVRSVSGLTDLDSSQFRQRIEDTLGWDSIGEKTANFYSLLQGTSNGK